MISAFRTGVVLTALCGAALSSVPAMAADLPVAPPVAPGYRAYLPSFTGCYAGANIGGGWTFSTWKDRANTFGFGYDTDLGTSSPIGVVGGGQVGCDYQINAWVFGIQGMFDGSGMTSSNVWQTLNAYSNTGKVPWFATVTGRIGITFVPSAMFYFKAGGAWLKRDYGRTVNGFVVPFVCAPGECGTASETITGVTAGLGAEWIFAGNWSVFVEYDYIGFSRHDVTFTNPAGALVASYPVSIQNNVNLLLFGFNYRFGGGAPVQAYY